MPLLLSYFQAALPAAVNCVVANNVHSRSYLSCVIEQLLLAQDDNSTRPSHRPQHNLNFIYVRVSVFICVCVAKIEEQTTC